MLDLTKAVKIFVDGKRIETVNFNKGNITWYDNSIKYEFTDNFKIKVTKDNKVEYYNLSYAENKKVPNYKGSIVVEDAAGVTYYAAVVSEKPSYTNMIIRGGYVSNGYYSTESQDGGAYNMSVLHHSRNITNKWYFKFNLQNKSGTYTIDSNLLKEAVRRYNASIPAANINIVSSSNNYCELAVFNDTWLGLCTSWSDQVRIQLNKKALDMYYGQFTTVETSSAYKSWLGTLTHELCHTLGFPDQASHTPSLYDYSRNRTKALFVQANDLTWLEYAYGQYGHGPEIFQDVALDEVPTAAPARTRLMANRSGGDECEMSFDFEYLDSVDDLERVSSNIVIANLEYEETKKIDIGNNLEIEYNVYNINIINEEKGSLINRKLKVISQMDKVDTEKTYKLYLMQYDDVPCSLVSDTGLVEL